MPYVIKATYHGQTRKLRSFHPYQLPTWDQLSREIQHVFWRVENFELANIVIGEPIDLKLPFSIGSAEYYDSELRYVVHAHEAWPGNVAIKFDVVDVVRRPDATKRSTESVEHSVIGDSVPTPKAAPRTAPSPSACCAHQKSRTDFRELAQKFLADFARLTAPFEDDVAGHLDGPVTSGSARWRRLEVICDGCDQEITGQRYKCTVCPNFDFCQECYLRNTKTFGTFGHPHQFHVVPQPQPQPAPQDIYADGNAGNSGAHAMENISTPVHNATCDSCFKTIRGTRHKCVDCEDYDLCDVCISKRDTVHNLGHKFVALREAGRVVVHRVDDARAPNQTPSTINAFVPYPESSNNAVHGALCDACDARIVGVRHKCLDCPDFDFCSQCFQYRGVLHPASHSFVNIDRPTKVVVHRVYDDPVEHNDEPSHRGHRHHRHRGRGLRGHHHSHEHHHVHRRDRSEADAAVQPQHGVASSLANHRATCDLCDTRIVGARYKCAVCPDYDTCESCFSITQEQHPNHSFIRITELGDYIHRRPPHVGQMPSHHTRCNSCNKVISSSGPRYKCTHPSCPDYDLCPNCEALPHPVHPIEHALLKLRVPASMVEPTENRATRIIHPEICNVCNGPITGVRYKCAECDDFDMCAGCESIPSSHPENHVLLKMKKVMEGSRVEPSVDEEAVKAVETSMEEINEKEVVFEGATAEPTEVQMSERPQRSSISVSSLLNPLVVPDEALMTEEHSFDAATLVDSRPGSIIELDGHFICDLSIPDGHALPPSSHFVKRWKLFNPGPRRWPENTVLLFTGGDRIGAPDSVHIGAIDPEQEVVVEAEMQAGSTEGEQVGFWRLSHDGVQFGHKLWVDIEVVNVSGEVMRNSNPSLESSAMVMPSAPSAPASAAAVSEPSSPFAERAEVRSLRHAATDPEASGQSLASSPSIVSISDLSDDWDEEMMHNLQAGLQQAHVNEDAHPDFGEQTGYVLVFDETDDEA